MVEEVETGGFMRFRYGRNYAPKLSEEQRRAIERGYVEAEERKKREKKRMWMILGILALIILIILAITLL